MGCYKLDTRKHIGVNRVLDEHWTLLGHVLLGPITLEVELYFKLIFGLMREELETLSRFLYYYVYPYNGTFHYLLSLKHNSKQKEITPMLVKIMPLTVIAGNKCLHW